MKVPSVPKWKYWLSYLVEQPIESIESEFNPVLHVSLIRGRYQLYTENAIYSFGDLYGNFKKSFQLLDLDALTGREVLILGLGLGSIPILLEKLTVSQWHISGVEKDDAVIYLANKYVLPTLQSTIQIYETDALAFVQQCQQSFDVICMDIFVDDQVPADFKTDAFLFELKRILSPDGLLLYNKLSR